MSPSAWDTSAKGEGADTRPDELSTLGEHRLQCSARSGRWVALRCGAGHVTGFVSSRLVTTAAGVFALMALWWTWG